MREIGGQLNWVLEIWGGIWTLPFVVGSATLAKRVLGWC